LALKVKVYGQTISMSMRWQLIWARWGTVEGKFYATRMAQDVVTGIGKIAPIKAGEWGVDFSFEF
jgi:hypothetical protein